MARMRDDAKELIRNQKIIQYNRYQTYEENPSLYKRIGLIPLIINKI